MTEISLCGLCIGVTVFLQSARQKVNHHLVGAIGRALELWSSQGSPGLDILSKHLQNFSQKYFASFFGTFWGQQVDFL